MQHAGSVIAARGLFIEVRGRLSSCGLRVLSLELRRAGSRARELFVAAPHGLSSCGAQAQDLWRAGLVALWHVGS